MTIDPNITRRVVLAAGAASAGTAVLAACSSSGSTDKSSSSAAGAATSSGPAPSSEAGGANDSTSAAGSSSSSDSGHSTDALATLAEIPVGEAVSVKLPSGKPGIVARPTATTAVCFSAICTHQGCTVKPAKKTLDCPCHGSQYDATTGKVLKGPAPSPLPKVAVSVRDGKVVSG